LLTEVLLKVSCAGVGLVHKGKVVKNPDNIDGLDL
jgi:hypothetical protein